MPLKHFLFQQSLIKKLLNTFPSLITALYGTLGVVNKVSILYSSSNLYLNTSICKTPKNPHLNPFPNADELSLIIITAGSVNANS